MISGYVGATGVGGSGYQLSQVSDHNGKGSSRIGNRGRSNTRLGVNGKT